MKLSRVLQIVKKHKPTVAAHLRGHLNLKFIGSGSYRKTYRVVNSPFLIKFPHIGPSASDRDNHAACVKHSGLEVAKHRHFSGFFELKAYLPKIYYYDKVTGIVVMEYIEENDDTTNADYWKYEALSGLVSVLIKSLTRKKLTDISDSNLRLSKGGQLKFIDLAF